MFFKKKEKPMSELTKHIISDAEFFAKSYTPAKGNFDFSIESLSDVNSFLDEVGDFIFDDEKALNKYAVAVGAYVFEVARRNYGGEYFMIKEEMQPVLVAGQPDFYVSIKAWDKVRKYVKEGPENDMKFYVDGYRSAVERGKNQKGYNARII